DIELENSIAKWVKCFYLSNFTYSFFFFCNTKLVRDQAFRDKVAKEIYSSERDYVKHLDVCVQVYFKPLLEGKKKVLDAETVKKMFSDIEMICSLNHKLLSEL